MSFSNIETISTIAERAMTIIRNGDSERSAAIDERDVMRLIRDILNTKIRGEIRQAEIDGETTVSEHFIATFELTIEEDAREECYATLPGNYTHLYNHRGIQRVRPIDENNELGRAMIPISPYEMDIYQDLNAGKEIVRQWCYEPAKGKIKFKRKQNQKIKDYYPKVEVSMISVDPSQLSNDDPLPVPPSYFYDILTEVLKVLGFQEQLSKE